MTVRRWPGAADREVDGGLVFGDFDALDLFELLDAGLNLFGLGGLGAEAVDEGFEGFDAVALVFVRRHQLGAALFFLRDVLLVVAVVGVHALVPEFDGLVYSDVEEVAVVRDEDVGVGIVVEVVFEPVAGFDVEVIGGLVEERSEGFCSNSLASAMRICQPPENSSVLRSQSSLEKPRPPSTAPTWESRL